MNNKLYVKSTKLLFALLIFIAGFWFVITDKIDANTFLQLMLGNFLLFTVGRQSDKLLEKKNKADNITNTEAG